MEYKEQAAVIIASGEYQVLQMGRPPGQRCKIVWRADGTLKTPVNGFLFIAEPGEVPFPNDVPDLVSESDDEQDDEDPEPTLLTGDPVQRGNRNAYEFVVLR